MRCEWIVLFREELFVNKRSTQHNQANSPLLRLPAELRNRIYGFVFDAATMERDLSPTSAGRYRVVLDGSRLLLVCRQTRFEARPFQRDFTYHQLSIRMQGKHMPDLVNWVGQAQCAQLVQINMFLSLASAIRRMVRGATLQGPYVRPWAASGDRSFPSLARVVVTYPIYLSDDAVEIGTSLQTLFGNSALDVHFCAATYW